MAIQTLYPSISPSLSLDFANVKSLDPRINFTRTTTATYYNGVTTAKAEENLLLRSQEFDVAANWIPNGVTISANTAGTTAPDGTSTAEKLQETATTQAHWVQQVAAVNGVVYTLSVFLKAAEKTYALVSNGTNHAITVDLTAGTAANATGTTSNVTCTAVGNNWFRVSFTFTALSTNLNFYSSTDGVWANRSYLGVAGEGVYLWGAQLEQRSSVTAYTPTTTEPITNYIPVLETAAAGQARFDHNPITGESLGLLVEEQRSNLVTYSEDLSNAAWTFKTNMSVGANYAVAPDGTLSADQIIENTSAGEHGLQAPNVSYTSGTSYTFSCYAKAAGRTILRVLFPSFAYTQDKLGYFDLSSGTVTSTSGTGITTSITAVGNGWYRLSMSAAATVTITTTAAQLRLVSSGTTVSYTGDGYSGLYIWGAQLE
jgi:hypothetical protein